MGIVWTLGSGGYMQPYQNPENIKKDASIIGLSMIVYMLSLNILTSLIYGAVELIARLVAGHVPSAIAYQLANICGYVAALMLTVFMMGRGEEWNYKKPKKPFMLMSLPVFFATFFAVNFVINSLFTSIFKAIGIHGVSGELSVPKEGLGLILAILQYAVFPAVLEELLFRGALMGRLRKYGDNFALLFSSAIFALMHHDIPTFPAIMLLGMAFGYMTIKSDSLFPAMLMHFLNNFIAVVSYYLVQHTKEDATKTFQLVLLGLAILSAGIIIALYFSKYRNEIVNAGLRPDRETHPGGRPLSGILENGWMITFLTIAVATTIVLEFLPRILQQFWGG